MSSYYTSDELIESIKRRAFIPSQQNTFSNAEFLAFADEEMNIGLVPSVVQMHEDYFLYTVRIPILPDVRRYAIPYRAIGNKLREVSFVDAQNNVFEMTRISVGDLPFYNNPYTYNRAYAFYISNNEVVLVPENITLSSGTFLSMSFYMRPNSLVMLDDVAVISAIDTVTGDVQVSNLPSTFNTNTLLDLIQVKSPHKTYVYDVAPVSINTTSKIITFNPSDLPANLSVGDHIALAEECAIPQVPSDLHVVLAHRVAARCLEALGDTEGLQAANQKLAEMEQKTQNLIDNRVEDAPQKIVNRHAILRRGTTRRFRFRG